MLGLDQARTAIRREMSELLDELGSAPDDAWSRRTRCTEWTVADLTAHLVWGQRLEAQGVEAVGTGRRTAREVPLVESSAAGLLEQLRQAHDELWDELAERTVGELTEPAPMPYGPVPFRLLLQVITMEVGVHHSDLRAALGLPADLAPDVVAATAAFLEAFLPALASAGSRPDGPVGYRLQGGLVDLALSFDDSAWTVAEPDVTASASFSGSDSDLCLFALGRIDVDSPRITVAGDLTAARRFRNYVPGA